MKSKGPRRRHPLQVQKLEHRNLLAGDICHNFVDAGDVNLDGNVTTIDALILINQLGVQKPEAVQLNESSETTMLVDVDENGFLTANDALRVINQLDSGGHDTHSLAQGVTQLAAAILTETLPPGMRPQTAQAWFHKLHQKIETPLQRREAFDHLDQNSDGELTREELPEPHWDRLSVADTDETGSITRDEAKAARPSEKFLTQVQNKLRPHFKSLDTNEDGMLTEDEVAEKLWSKISTADINEDGAVSLSELEEAREQWKPDLKRPIDELILFRFDTNEDGLLTEDEVNEKVWGRIVEADANDDGAVSFEELQDSHGQRVPDCPKPIIESIFERFDVNKDGSLTADEVNEKLWSRLAKADINEDGAVSLSELEETREQWEPDHKRPIDELIFARFDTNKDGLLTEDEVNEKVWGRIVEADANDDGAVSFEELQDSHGQRVPDCPKPIIESIFERFDVNKDGSLTADEVNEKLWHRIAQADTDDDGAVSLEEILAAFQSDGVTAFDTAEDRFEGLLEQLAVNRDSITSPATIKNTVLRGLSAIGNDAERFVPLNKLSAFQRLVGHRRTNG